MSIIHVNTAKQAVQVCDVSKHTHTQGVRHQLEFCTIRLESQMESVILHWNLESCTFKKSN